MPGTVAGAHNARLLDPGTVDGLADYLLVARDKKRADADRAQSSYGAGLDAGMAIAYDLAARWLREALDRQLDTGPRPAPMPRTSDGGIDWDAALGR